MTKIDSLLHGREAGNRRKITFDCDCVAATGLLEPTRADDAKPDACGLEPTGMRTCTKMAREQYVARSMQHWHIVKIDADGKETVVGITDSERDAKAEAARHEREAEHTPKPGERA